MAANGATSASNEKANLEATDVASLSSAQHAEEAPRGSQDDWTVEEENAIRKKADWHVFPMLSFVFGLSLIDRINISLAYIAGMSRDLELTVGARYSIALLVFFIGYAIFEIPSNMVIRRLGAQIWLCFLVTAWGLCCMGMGFVQSWKTLTVCRALLGVFEAGLFPGAMYIIGSWYRQFETAKRTTIFYMAAMVSNAVAPLLAYGLSLIRVGDGLYRQGWRWIFIIEGLITVLAGFATPFLMIEFPEKVRWLTPRQKYIAQARVQEDKASRAFVHPTFKESLHMLVDWKLFIYAFQYFIASTSGYSLAYFKPIIINQGMGFNYVMSQVLMSPPYVFAVIMSLITSHFSDRYRIRWPFMVGQSLVCVVGGLIILYGKLSGVRYFGIYLMTWGVNANIPGTLAYASSSTAEVRKKGVTSGAIISFGAIGGIAGSTIFRSQDAPQYVPGMWTVIVLQIVYSLLTFSLSMWKIRQNRLADEGKRPALEGVEGFRYAP